MKTKLLKIVRKRYYIEHYPHGKIYKFETFDPTPVTVLHDRRDSWRYIASYEDVNQAYSSLYKILLRWILKDYISLGKRRLNKSKITKKLWYERKI